MSRPRAAAAGRLRPAIALAVLALAVGGCGFAAQVVVTPAPSATPIPSLSPTLVAARTQVISALAPAGFQVTDAQVPYRPGESPSVTAAPRHVLQALIPAAPDRGYIVLYEFADPAAAAAAAQEDARYIATGPGRVQFPSDARFTLRQLGAAVVFYVWSPGASPAPNDESALAAALGSLGQGYPVQP